MGMSGMVQLLFNGILQAQGGGIHHDGWLGYRSAFTGGFFMWLIPIILLGFLAYFIFQRQDGDSSKGKSDSPLDILKKRYARGEISQKEFERMRSELNNDEQ